MTAPPRLVFHLGDFKTGTTVLQRWLAAPGAEGRHPFVAPPRMPHVDLVHSLKRPQAQSAAFAPVAALLRQAPRDRIVVVSAEHFEFADPALLREAIATHLAPWADRVRLVAWVRPHLSALLSRYSESTKIGSFDGPPRAFLDWPQTVRRMTYAPRFARWRDTFGDAFVLRLYDRDGPCGPDGRDGPCGPGGRDGPSGPGGRDATDIRRDFIRAATGRDPGVLPDPGRGGDGEAGGGAGAGGETNDRLGLRHLALARALHRALLAEVARTGAKVAAGSAAEAARWTLGRHLGRMLAQRSAAVAGAGFDPGPPLVADRSLVAAVTARFAADAAALDATFFAGQDAAPPAGDAAAPTGPLGAALARALDHAPERSPDPDPEALLSPEVRAVVALWGAMLAHPLTDPSGAAALDRLFHENGP